MRGADVRSIQHLADLRAALLRFGADAEAALCTLEVHLRQTLEYLGERQRYWEPKVRAAEEEYRLALAALKNCQSHEVRDPKTGRSYVPPCNAEKAWVARAQKTYYELLARLNEVLQWRHLVERSAEEYQRHARRLEGWLRQELAKASQLLDSEVTLLCTYASLGVGGAAVVPSAFTTTPPADAATKAAAAGVLLAAIGVGAVGIAVIRWLSQGRSTLLGDVGEALAADLVRQEGNLREIPFNQPKHGFDRVFLSPDGQVVILESKVHKHGEFHPGQTRAGEQGSPEWIAATADRMADPSSAQWSPANERIAALIREIGPEQVPVIGVVIETATGRANVYYRKGDNGWTLLEDVSLAEVLSADLSSPSGGSGGLERERSPEQEINLGGVEGQG